MLWYYLIPTMVWGSTWLVIKSQLGVVPPEVSVFYRFILAALVSFGFCLWRGVNLRYLPRHHRWFALQGFCNFSMNYILTYYAESYVASGLVAVTFTVLPYLNGAGQRWLYKQRLESSAKLAMLLGGVGIFLIFRRELLQFDFQSSGFKGLLIGTSATVFASAGNLTSVRHLPHRISALASTSWAMLYGALSTLVICFIFQKNFTWDPRPVYGLSLVYLAVLGTVIPFLMYFTLISKVGAGRAAYTSIMIPVIALLLSHFYEGYQLETLTLLGIGLCLTGNFLVFKRPAVVR